MTSLASNEIFKFSFNKIYLNIFILLILLFFLILILFEFNIYFLNIIKNLENLSFFYIKNLSLNNDLILNKIFNFPINLISILLVNYLFLTLIARVKITNIFKGPLRPSN